MRFLLNRKVGIGGGDRYAGAGGHRRARVGLHRKSESPRDLDGPSRAQSSNTMACQAFWGGIGEAVLEIKEK